MQFKKIEHIKAGEEITEGFLNAIAERLEMFANLQSGSPYIRLLDSPYGKSIALAMPQRTFGLLSGSSSPYSFTEVRDGRGGTWVSMPNGDSGTSNCYEVNSVPNLGGKVVELHWSSVGDWRFQYVAFAPPTFNWTFNVFGCNSTAIAGATIELRQSGVLIDSCVTGDGTGGTTLGRCTLNVAPGTYDITITATGFTTSTSTASIAATKTTNTTLTSDASHTCSSCCGYSFPNTIHFTDSDGPQTLTLVSTSPNLVYTLNSTTQVPETCNFQGLPGPCTGCASPGTALKSYELTILSAGCTARLRIFTSVTCCDGLNSAHFCNDLTLSTQVGSNITIPITSGNCSPLNLVFSVPTSFNNACSGNSLPTPGGGGTLAFTS
jgi:hypothetical protein